MTFDLERSRSREQRSSQEKQEEGEERGRKHKAKVQSGKMLKVKLNLNPLRKSRVHPKSSKKTREKRHEDEEREERKKKKSSKAEEKEEEERGKSKVSNKQKKDPSKKEEVSNKGSEAEEQPASSSSAAQAAALQYQGAALLQQSFSLSAASRNQTTNLSLLGPAGSQLSGSSLSLQGGHFLFPSGPGTTPGGAPDSLSRLSAAGLTSPAAPLQTFSPQTLHTPGLTSSIVANPAAALQSFTQPPVSSPLVAALNPDPAPQTGEAHELPPESAQSSTPHTQVPPGAGALIPQTPGALIPQTPGAVSTAEDASKGQSQTDSVQRAAALTVEGLSVNEGLTAAPTGEVGASTQSVSSSGDALLQQEYLSEDGGSSPRRKLRLVLPEKTSGRPPTALERKIR